MNKIFFLIITLTLLFSGCMISSNTIYKISKSYVGEYKLSDTTCVVINLMLYNKKNGTLHTTEIKKRNGYKSEIENLYLISIEFDTIALTGEFVDNVKYKIQQRADNVYIHPIDSIPDRILFFDKTHKVIILKAEKQIKDLEQKARESKSKKERTKIENKIRNIRQNAERRQGGEEHSRSTTKR